MTGESIEVDKLPASDAERLIAKLRGQLETEIYRGKYGHPDFDANRLLAIRQAIEGLSEILPRNTDADSNQAVGI